MPFSPRVGCLISFLVVVLPVCLMLGVAALWIRGEFVLKLGPVQEVRVWLARQGPEQGLGYSSMKQVSECEASDRICYETEVNYLLWRSLELDRQATYCDCYELDSSTWVWVGVCP
jgi:hypothetical protein